MNVLLTDKNLRNAPFFGNKAVILRNNKIIFNGILDKCVRGNENGIYIIIKTDYVDIGIIYDNK
jgi:hypothetical protein